MKNTALEVGRSLFRMTPSAWILSVLAFLFIQAVTVFFIVLAPELGLYIFLYVLLALVVVLVFRLASPQAPLWIRVLFLVVLGNFVLNYGFSNFSVGLGSARVTVGELVLLLSLTWVAIRAWGALWIEGASTFLLLVYALPPLVLHLPMNLAEHGITAARDALPLLDSLFFFGGICVVAFARNAEQWKSWRHRFLWLLLIAALIYFPFYPFQKALLAYSPKVTGYQQAVPLVGYFATSNVLALAGLMATILIPDQFAWRAGNSASRWLIAVAFIVFAFAVVMMQSRATYIVAGLTMLLLAVGGHGIAARRLVVIFMAAVVGLAAIDFSGVEFEGRVGKVGLEMLSSQLESVTGEGGLESARSGVDQRKNWTAAALSRWASSPGTIATGVGFGVALTNFSVGGAGGKPVVVREPHNSYVSVLTRTGLLGLVPWLIFHLVLLLKLWQKFRYERQKNDTREADYWLWMFMLFISLLVTAVVQPVFESPHFAVPYFFLAGLCFGEIARANAGWPPLVKFNEVKDAKWFN
ncbi:MAG: O-antigen ligase family protein [Candidatus Accumulibacter phosphatis]|uniref:O-antigen ligase family protein n=1 Tax=Candidatus Accumulibacter sp. ACC012 TaxID=2823332 RepID=UPI0025C54595|nr:O-antigen ligase family protein [Candidatus Accumulibacter sp. ACC012]